MSPWRFRRAPLAALTTAVATVAVGCGGGSSDALMYILFDATQSSSLFIREGYREDARLQGEHFCERYRSRGEVVLNVITPTPEADSQFVSLKCPVYKNETQFKAAMFLFKARLQAAVDGIIQIQADPTGSDVIQAILFGADQTFRRFKPDVRYLSIFSDMQQSGGGVRNCVKSRKTRQKATCLDMYLQHNPELRERDELLEGVAVYVTGFGATIRGTLEETERQAYKSFWRRFFTEQRARVCWFSPASLPIIVRDDQSRGINPRYFREDCPPAL